MWFSTSFDITWYTEAAIYAKDLLFSQKNNSGGVRWNVETNIKTLHPRSNVFKKKNSKYEILNHLYFGPVFIFVGTALLTMVADTFTQPNHHKKASYGPVIKKKQNQFLLRGCKIVPWYYVTWGDWNILPLEPKIYKDFELYQFFKHTFYDKLI